MGKLSLKFRTKSQINLGHFHISPYCFKMWHKFCIRVVSCQLKEILMLDDQIDMRSPSSKARNTASCLYALEEWVKLLDIS